MSGLADAISAGDSNPRDVGRKVILPSSFTGRLVLDRCLSYTRTVCL